MWNDLGISRRGVVVDHVYLTASEHPVCSVRTPISAERTGFTYQSGSNADPVVFCTFVIEVGKKPRNSH